MDPRETTIPPFYSTHEEIIAEGMKIEVWINVFHIIGVAAQGDSKVLVQMTNGTSLKIASSFAEFMYWMHSARLPRSDMEASLT